MPNFIQIIWRVDIQLKTIEKPFYIKIESSNTRTPNKYILLWAFELKKHVSYGFMPLL